MTRRRRISLIKEIEEKRQSRMIVYFTGDRRGLETRIASDVFPFMLEHLEKIGSVEKLDLFLYTPGGVTIAGTGLVALLREYCKKLSVIIPFKAQSAGTLVALGADTIVMSKVAQLSPVDPSVHSPYNPQAPGQQPGQPPGQPLPVNVEEAIGYLNLAREEAKISDDKAMADIFKELSNKVHPLALGNVYRARQQIKMLATQLLMKHMGESKKGEVDKIVDKLTKELYSHDYIIGRAEAKELLGEMVEDVGEETEKLIWKLYKEYEDLMDLTTPLNPLMLLGDENEKKCTFTRGIIESRLQVDAFQSIHQFIRQQITPPGSPVQIPAIRADKILEQWVRKASI